MSVAEHGVVSGGFWIRFWLLLPPSCDGAVSSVLEWGLVLEVSIAFIEGTARLSIIAVR